MKHRTLIWSAAIFLLVFGCRLVLIQSMGSACPFADEWDAEGGDMVPRHVAGEYRFADLFKAHNEHRILLSRVVFIALLKAHGLWDPLLQMIANAALHASFAVLFFLFGHRCHPQARHVFAVASVLLNILPYDYENALTGFQSSFSFLLITALASIWLLLDSQPLGTKWWLGWLPLVLGVFSMVSGFFPALAVVTVHAWLMIFRKEHRSVRHFAATGLLLAYAFITMIWGVPHSDRTFLWRDSVHALQLFLSWPVRTWPGGMLLVLAPLFVGLIQFGRRRIPATPSVLLILGFSVWYLGQAVAVAIGRADHALAIRYLSIQTCGIGCALLWSLVLWHQKRVSNARRLNWGIPLLASWAALTSTLLVKEFFTSWGPLAEISAKRIEQEEDVNRYLLTGDATLLEGRLPEPLPPYPFTGHLQPILDNPLLRTALPSELSLPVPGVVTQDTGTFTSGNFPPGAPPAPYRPAWGSYSTETGEAATGALIHAYERDPKMEWHEIWILGAPSPKGTSLTIQRPDGKKKIRVLPKYRPGFKWHRLLVRIPYSPFQVVLSDHFSDRWMAFTAPRRVGNLEPQKAFLLDNGGWIVAVGTGLVIFLALMEGLTAQEISRKVTRDDHQTRVKS